MLPFVAPALAAGYITCIAVSPTMATNRKSLLDHVSRDLIQKPASLGHPTNADEVRKVHANLIILREHIETGWTTPKEIVAAVQVCGFLLSKYTKETLDGALTLAENSGNAFIDKFEELLDSIEKDLNEKKRDAA